MNIHDYSDDIAEPSQNSEIRYWYLYYEMYRL